MHPNSPLLFEKWGKQYFQPRMRVLEIGPDASPSSYQRIVGDPSILWESVDMIDRPNLTYKTADEYSFPIESGAYDVVLSGQVLEHVRKVWVWIKEVARVCKPGGLVITINPVSWPFHEAPYDCWRVYPDGMKALYEEASLEVIFSTWESLEIPGYRRYIPGMSIHLRTFKGRLANQVVGFLGYPIERAYDTITIGRKPDRRVSCDSGR